MEARKDYISWDEYFMLIARVSAMRSKDPNTQVGACIVNDDKKKVQGVKEVEIHGKKLIEATL